MYLIFADRRGSFIFPSIFMIVIIGVPRGSATKGRKVEVSRKYSTPRGYLLARATSHCNTASRFVSSFALIP